MERMSEAYGTNKKGLSNDSPLSQKPNPLLQYVG